VNPVDAALTKAAADRTPRGRLVTTAAPASMRKRAFDRGSRAAAVNRILA
jgi:hypothetical protein